MNERLFSTGRVACAGIFTAALLGTVSLVPLLIPRAERFTPKVQPVPIAGARAPVAPRLIFIMVDGLGSDMALSSGFMPRLQAQLRQAAWGTALASFPTLTPNGLRALLSGRTGVPEPVFLGGMPAHWERDSVMARASAAGRRVFTIGQQDWPALFKDHAAHMELVAYTGRPEDPEVLRRAMRILRGDGWDFLAIHLFDLDGIGHREGTRSADYRRKLLWLDGRIMELAAAAGPQAAVLVTADHGQAADGSHGGMEMVVRRVPYVLWGRGIHPGRLGTFAQNDSASTLAAFMGLPPPIQARGLPHLEAFEISARDKASVMLDLLEQRRRRWFAARTDWPWLTSDPDSALQQARTRWQAGAYSGSAATAERAVAAVDHELDAHSPSQWVGRLTWLLWLMVLAASFSAAWPMARPRTRIAAGVLVALCLGLLVLPLRIDGLWPPAMAWGLAASAGLLLLSMSSGLDAPALSWRGWFLWWAALATIAFPSLVDVSLWSWAVLVFLLALRLARWERPGLPPLAWAAATLAACAVMSAWASGTEMSTLRYCLPHFDLRRFGAAPWRAVELGAALALAAVLYRRLVAELGRKPAMISCAVAVAPVVLALLPWPQALRHWTWGLCLLSLGAAWLSPLPPQAKAFWASLAGLAFCRTQSSGSEACLLALATLAGWRWALLTVVPVPLWEGLGLVGLCLWAYVLPGGRLDFSHISVAAAYSGMGKVWNPRLLAALAALKPIGFLLTPILGLLVDLPAVALPSGMTVLGALSAGSMTLLWFDKFYFKLPMSSLVDTSWYERLLWGGVTAWLLILAWAGLQAFTYRRPCAENAPAGSR
ncbi:MAG: alkaline phosphatase family protein [Elusimicrobia bacterium]|nr:alkaline phosphatase family protein [Elusimicrobiota bacterium]